MALNYYNPADLVQHDATFNYIAKAGVGFGILPNNEQVFFTARMVQEHNLCIGDSVRVFAVDNYASPETMHFASRWRAVRVQIVQRIDDIVAPKEEALPKEQAAPAAPAAPAVVPTPMPSYAEVMTTLLNARRPWTINTLAHAVSKTCAPQADLIQKVGTKLAALHRNNEIASLKVYAGGDKERASAIYYAKDTDVFYEYLDTPLEEE